MGGPLHGLITASTVRPLPSYFQRLASPLSLSHTLTNFPPCPPHLLATGSGNILGNAKQRKSATQKQAPTRQTTKQLASVWSGWNNRDLSGNSPFLWETGRLAAQARLKAEKHNNQLSWKRECTFGTVGGWISSRGHHDPPYEMSDVKDILF